jgi:hypothetical protein
MSSSRVAILLVTSFLLPAGARAGDPDPAGAPGLTELTQVARQFPRHQGPTVLYVNFDGWKNHDGKGHDVLPFQPTTGRRDRDIQVILFRTAEIYAPFDVEVRRLRGNGKRDSRNRGNTTVFVGANTDKVNGKGAKYTSAFTPTEYSDRPGSKKGDGHRPNSDPFDIAFVDPVGQEGGGWRTVKTNDWVSQAIAHEAGHTFGLVHTLTDPVKEVMSYNAKNIFFANRSFPISNLNFDAVKRKAVPAGNRMFPRWRGQWVNRQNSYTYLLAVLGSRPADDRASVAQRGAVDPAFRDGPVGELRPGAAQSGTVERRGDYDVFVLRADSAGRLAVRVDPSRGSRLAPVLLVFDAQGHELLAFASGKARRDRAAWTWLKVAAGQPCKVVVGAADCATTGAYQVTAGSVAK